MLDTILTVIGDVAALAAALFAFLALRKASETIREAKKDRFEAEQNRLRDRIEHVGEILEAMASAAVSTRYRFTVHHNRLGLALAGLREQLPKCMTLFNEVTTPDQFTSYDINPARNEIDDELNSLSSRLTRPASLEPPTQPG
jgi:hypothetical protein